MNGAPASKLGVHIEIGFIMVTICFQNIQGWVRVNGPVSGLAQSLAMYWRKKDPATYFCTLILDALR